MADTSAGFRPRYRLCGEPFTIQSIVFQDSETLTKGDIINVESGLADLAVSGDVYLTGVALETKAGTTAVSTIDVIVDEDAVYGVYDATARAMGAQLDITGTTGAMTVAADGDHDLTVVATSTATEETLVKITHGLHIFSKTYT